jgi:hypothetical protein
VLSQFDVASSPGHPASRKNGNGRRGQRGENYKKVPQRNAHPLLNTFQKSLTALSGKQIRRPVSSGCKPENRPDDEDVGPVGGR